MKTQAEYQHDRGGELGPGVGDNEGLGSHGDAQDFAALLGGGDTGGERHRGDVAGCAEGDRLADVGVEADLEAFVSQQLSRRRGLAEGRDHVCVVQAR